MQKRPPRGFWCGSCPGCAAAGRPGLSAWGYFYMTRLAGAKFCPARLRWICAAIRWAHRCRINLQKALNIPIAGLKTAGWCCSTRATPSSAAPPCAAAAPLPKPNGWAICGTSVSKTARAAHLRPFRQKCWSMPAGPGSKTSSIRQQGLTHPKACVWCAAVILSPVNSLSTTKAISFKAAMDGLSLPFPMNWISP